MMNAQALGTSKSDDFKPQNSKSFETFEGIEIDQMYREHILDHYRNPRNKGKLQGLHFHDKNPLCGDEIDIYALVQDGTLRNISFEGNGCAVSQASASILTEYVKGKKADEITSMGREEMEELLGITVSVMRVKCMMLALVALKKLLRGVTNGHA